MMDMMPRSEMSLWVRNACLLLCAGAMILFAILQSIFQVDIFLLLGVFYSWSLLFGPIVLWSIYWRREQASKTIVAAVVLGVAAGTIAALNPLNLPLLVAPVFSQVIGMITSAGILTLLCALNRVKEPIK